MRSPVFRHAGSWRHAGTVRRAFHPIAPRRRCGAVVSTMACIVLCVNVVWWSDGLPPPPGWHHGGALRVSPHVADTPVGEIRGGTHGFNPCRGRRNVRLWSSGAASQRGRALRCAGLAASAAVALRCYLLQFGEELYLCAMIILGLTFDYHDNRKLYF